MAMLNTIQCGILFAVGALLLATPSSAQLSKKDERAFRERGSDSAWIFSPFFGRTRFYLGTNRVSGLEFENTLRAADPEIERLMTGAWRKLSTAQWLSLGASVPLLAGLLTSNSWAYNYNSGSQTGTYLLFGTALALETVSLVFSIDGNNKFRAGMRMFNEKARAGTLQPQLNVGVTANGVGVTLQL